MSRHEFAIRSVQIALVAGMVAMVCYVIFDVARFIVRVWKGGWDE